MPLLNNDEFQAAPLPTQEVIQSLETPDVFYIPFTGEIFATYEYLLLTREYYARIVLYRSRVWTCQETGKKGMTYQQALDSERKAILKQEVAYPAVWVKPTLEMIHGSRYPLNELVDTIHDFFRGTRFVDEFVFIDVPQSASDRAVERAIIKEKLPNTVPVTIEKKVGDKRQMQRELREAKDDMSRVPEDHHHYRVQLVSHPDREYIVTPSQMRRGRQSLSKITFKKYIKEVATKEKWVGSPWMVKVFKINQPNLLARYNINPNVSAEMFKKPDLTPKKPKRNVDLYEHPIEDTELYEESLIIKTDPAISIPENKLCFNFGEVTAAFVLPLIKVYNFVYVCGQPLALYPFKFNDFLAGLECKQKDLCCDLIPEVFASLLRVACGEYQAKFDVSSGGAHPYYQLLPKADSTGSYSSDPEESETISKVLAEYKSFGIHDRVAVDQWYKWRPGQWGAQPQKKKAKALITSKENLKAWQVALFGLVKDWYVPGSNKSIKWNVLWKLLLSAEAVTDEKMANDEENENSVEEADEAEEIEDLVGDDVDMLASDDGMEDSVDISPKKHKIELSDEEDELESEEDLPAKRQSRGARSSVSSTPQPEPKPKSTPKPKKSAKKAKIVVDTGMLFAELCERMENGFWSLTADERVQLLDFLVETCVQHSDVMRSYRDSSIEKTTELVKQQREIARQRKALASTIAALEKSETMEPVVQVELSDGSDNEFDTDAGRRSRRTRHAAAKKMQIELAKKQAEAPPPAPLDLADLTPEQLEIRKEREALAKNDLVLARRSDIIEYELRMAQAVSRFKPLGRDRLCNKYWWFDGGLGAHSLDVITQIKDVPDQVDPLIPHEFAFGFVFVEQFFSYPSDSMPPEVLDADSDVRLGLADGKWGYYEKPEQVALI